MKNKKLLLFLCVLFTAFGACAQAPQSIPYQAVARDTVGTLIANQNIALRFTVHNATATGTTVYQETQNVTTNVLATFTVNIGTGTPVTGIFSSISWGTGLKYIQIEMDPTGGTSYINMGTQQLQSVPYALYSNTAGALISSGTGSSPNTLLYTSDGF